MTLPIERGSFQPKPAEVAEMFRPNPLRRRAKRFQIDGKTYQKVSRTHAKQFYPGVQGDKIPLRNLLARRRVARPHDPPAGEVLSHLEG